MKVLQYCIDACMFDETLAEIPASVKIKKLWWKVGDPFGTKRRNEVSNKLKQLGVYYRSVPSVAKELNGCFEDLPRPTMKENLDKICELEGLDRQRVRVQRILLTYEDVEADFRRIRKQIKPDKTDQRKKLTVLGLEQNSGPIAKLIKQMSLGKYSCKVENVTVKRVVCNKE